MAIASVLLGVASLLMMFGGVFLFWMPVVGSLLSFGGPVLALIGIVLGGLAMSRAKQDGMPSGAALAGVILNVVGFLFGLLVAMTCGLCNAACTSAMFNAHAMDGGVGWQGNMQFGPDGGTFDVTTGDAGDPGLDQVSPTSGAGGAPPPAFPPPALDPSAAQPPAAAPSPEPAPVESPAPSRSHRSRGAEPLAPPPP